MRRNFIPTLMQTFDLPTPFSTVGKRNVTNVPAQSLALMNDPLFHEQSRVWAERLLRETVGETSSARVRWLYEMAYARLPREAETEACVASLDEPRSTDKTILTADSVDSADIGGPAVDVGRGEDYRRMVLNAGNRGRS